MTLLSWTSKKAEEACIFGESKTFTVVFECCRVSLRMVTGDSYCTFVESVAVALMVEFVIYNVFIPKQVIKHDLLFADTVPLWSHTKQLLDYFSKTFWLSISLNETEVVGLYTNHTTRHKSQESHFHWTTQISSSAISSVCSSNLDAKG